MSSRCSKAASAIRLAAVVLGAVLTHRAEAAAVNVCVDSANPTSTMDARVARAALENQGQTVRVVPFVGLGRGGGGFPIRRFAQMAGSRCQLIMGFPVDASAPRLPPGVLSTAAYVTTGFILVGAGNKPPPALDRLPPGTEVGIANLDTEAGLLFTTHHNIVMHVYASDDHMLRRVERRRLGLALTWQPFLESYEFRHPRHGPLSFHLLSGPHLVWNLVALYAAGQQATAAFFNRGVESLRRSGRLQSLTAPYAAPAEGTARGARVRPRPLDSPELAVAQGRLIRVADRHGAAQETPPALYTAAQAEQGAKVYATHCASCHGEHLEGRVGPALKGSDFADPSSDFHVGDIFGFVSRMMPAATPGSLSHEQYVAIMAFLLQQNGYPAGSHPLTYRGAANSKVPLIYRGTENTN